MLHLRKKIHFVNDRNCRKCRDHCHYTVKYRGVAYNICNLVFNVSNETFIDFHHRSNYDYHFIIKQLAGEFNEKFECLWENTQKYFFVLIEKELRNVNKHDNDIIIAIYYKITFIDSSRCMAILLSSVVDNLEA